MSWNATLIPAFAKIIPVIPPKVNKNKKPKAYNKGVVISILLFHIVANQLKILIPVGTAIIIVAAVKYARESAFKPAEYIWWAQTKNPKKPIVNIA